MRSAGLQSREVRGFEKERTRRRRVTAAVDAFDDRAVARVRDGAGHQLVGGEKIAEHAMFRTIELGDSTDEEARRELIGIAQIDDVNREDFLTSRALEFHEVVREIVRQPGVRLPFHVDVADELRAPKRIRWVVEDGLATFECATDVQPPCNLPAAVGMGTPRLEALSGERFVAARDVEPEVPLTNEIEPYTGDEHRFTAALDAVLAQHVPDERRNAFDPAVLRDGIKVHFLVLPPARYAHTVDKGRIHAEAAIVVFHLAHHQRTSGAELVLRLATIPPVSYTHLRAHETPEHLV